MEEAPGPRVVFRDALARALELGVRSAVAASPGRLMRQLVTESLVLAAGGALLGFVLADAGMSYLFIKEAIAVFVGNILWALIQLILAFVPGVGQLIGAILGLIDALVMIFTGGETSTAEVIVIDDSSIDDTARLAAAAGARVVRSTMLGKGASMADGVREALAWYGRNFPRGLGGQAGG